MTPKNRTLEGKNRTLEGDGGSKIVGRGTGDEKINNKRADEADEGTRERRAKRRATSGQYTSGREKWASGRKDQGKRRRRTMEERTRRRGDEEARDEETRGRRRADEDKRTRGRGRETMETGDELTTRC